MRIEVYKDPKNPGDWVVREFHGDGHVLVVTFSGLEAGTTADKYAAWRQTPEGESHG